MSSCRCPLLNFHTCRQEGVFCYFLARGRGSYIFFFFSVLRIIYRLHGRECGNGRGLQMFHVMKREVSVINICLGDPR